MDYNRKRGVHHLCINIVLPNEFFFVNNTRTYVKFVYFSACVYHICLHATPSNQYPEGIYCLFVLRRKFKSLYFVRVSFEWTRDFARLVSIRKQMSEQLRYGLWIYFVINSVLVVFARTPVFQQQLLCVSYCKKQKITVATAVRKEFYKKIKPDEGKMLKKKYYYRSNNYVEFDVVDFGVFDFKTRLTK